MPTNAFENPTVIAAETLSAIGDALVIGNLLYRDKTTDFGKNNGFAVGDTVNIKQRPDYEVNEFTAGGNITVQDTRESKRSLEVEKHFDVSMSIGAKERALDFDGFNEQVITPAALRMANKIDNYLGTKIFEAAGQNNATAAFGAATDIAAHREAATRQRISEVGRFALLGLTAETTLLGATWFNQSQTRGAAGEASLSNGEMGDLMGMRFFSSINVPETQQTVANLTGLTNNTSGTKNLIGDTNLEVDGTAATTINAGDRIIIAGVPTMMICATTTAATVTVIPLVNPIMEIIPDDAAVSLEASGLTYTNQAVITEGNAYAYAVPPLDAPEGANSAVVSADGFSLRVVSAYNITTKVQTLSLDMLIGATIWDPRKAMAITQGS